jgi:heat shock protein HtpX
MKRLVAGRDIQLSARMVVVLVLLAGAYATIVVGVASLYRGEPTWWPWITLFSVLIGSFAVAHVIRAGDLLLRSVGVDLDSRTPRIEELRARLQRLTALAELPMPRLGVASSEDANAFTVGIRKTRAVVVVTTALLDRLDGDEVEAVLAHELSHVANRDGAVMTLASVPASIGRTLTDAEAGNAFFLWFFLWPARGLDPGSR